MNIIKSTGTFSFYTIISRISGYARDILIAIFLFSSSFWIHSTFSYIDSPTQNQWLFIQVELYTTAFALILFTLGLASAKGVENKLNHKIAVIGSALITFHCLILDAIIWTSKFPKYHLH